MAGRRARARKPLVWFGASALTAFALLAAPVAARPPDPKPDAPGQGGLEGSNGTIVESQNTPARIYRVAVRPGSGGNEVWGIGHVLSTRPDWASSETPGQVVFVRNDNKAGWFVTGPPVDVTPGVNGTVYLNPNFNALAIDQDGEGWAVGQGGTIAHKPANSNVWEIDRSRCQSLSICSTSLEAITLSPDGNSGYAVGADGLVLRLQGGSSWVVDAHVPARASGPVDTSPATGSNGPPTLAGVALDAASGEAWAIAQQGSDSSGRGIELYKRNTNPVTWQYVASGVQALDDPAPTLGGGDVRLAVQGRAAVAASDGSFWFAGDIFPFDPAQPEGGANGTSDSPFALHYVPTSTSANKFMAYCTPTSSTTNAATGTASVCGSGTQALPPAALPITSLSAVEGGEVFAGGLGLFHFKPGGAFGRWFREPDPVGYLGSIAFANKHEGWLASTGGLTGLSNLYTSSIAVGHVTAKPPPDLHPRVARWAYPSTVVPYAVTVPPSGDAPALIVGEGGVVLKRTALGWDSAGLASAAPSGENHTHLAIAYAGNSGVAWAVGEAGYAAAIDHGVVQNPEPQLTTKAGAQLHTHLYGVAFSAPSIGYAVGAGGAIVHYDSRGKEPGKCFTQPDVCWIPDAASGVVTQKSLFAVTPIGKGPGFVAVGAEGTVLVNSDGAPGNWQQLDTSTVLRKSGKDAPSLFAADSLADADNTVVIGGGHSTLLLGKKLTSPTARSLTSAPAPQEGTLLALDARLDGGTMKLVASLAPNANPGNGGKPTTKYDGGIRAGTTRGWLVEFDGKRWRDLQPSSNRTSLAPGVDYAMSRDPVYAIASEPDGRSGWAVGGRWERQPGDDGSSYETSTRSVYRYDVDGDAQSPGDAPVAVVPSKPATYSFAFFSDTSCGTTLCSLTAGTGTAADEVALRIRDDINAAYDNDKVHGPQFVLFGGSTRGSGTAEEMGQFAAYLAGFHIPVFGAPGFTDLTQPTLPAPPAFPGLPYNQRPPDTSGQTGTAGNTTAYQSGFASMPAPWGTKGTEQNFSVVTAGGNGGARTHYAFDYAPGPTRKPVGRFVIIDTSNRTLAPTGQNPDEPQNTFLADTLTAAAGKMPTFVVSNFPTRNPSTFSNDPLLPANDVTTIEGAVGAAGTTAVFTGGVHGNYTYPATGVRGAVPFYVAGTGGAPLSGTATPKDGHYHAWLLATVDNARVNGDHPQAALTVQTVPVVESVAFVKDRSQLGQDRLVVQGGNAMLLHAIARGVDGGGRANDTKSMNRLYIDLPVSYRCGGGGDAPFENCFNKRGLEPDYRFVSEDTSIADFVYGAGSSSPVRTNGRLVNDPKSGLLCAFRTGNVWVRVEAGGHQARIPVTVVPGKGPCVTDAVVDLPPPPNPDVVPDVEEKIVVEHREGPPPPPKPAVKVPAPAPKPAIPAPPQLPEPTPVIKPVPKVFLAPHPLAELVPALMPPAPSLLPSPAPPASATAAGAQKQEDKEVEHESAGQEGGDFVAISHRRDQTFDPAMGWMLMGMAALLGLFGAGVAATMKGGERRAAHVPITYPRELR
jgi:outer membrane biosynthesis protein TonB